MTRIILLAVIAMLLAGCKDWTQMNCAESSKVTSSTITWSRVDDPYQVCLAKGAETLERGGACITCTAPDGGHTFCTLYANNPATIDDIFLGHETKHAFGCRHA